MSLIRPALVLFILLTLLTGGVYPLLTTSLGQWWFNSQANGSLTTFSIANDVAKYFAIIPAAFAAVYPQLAMLNVMGLHSPSSAILSAVIFNALIIVFLIPLALKGVSYRPLSASAMLRRNLWIYGLGGLLVPFIGIKAIDLLLTLSGLV